MSAGLFDEPSVRTTAGTATPAEIPPPRFRLGTRVLLPLALVAATVALILGSAWRSLFPGTPVEVVPVLVKTMEGTVGTASVTATGWLEPDPYPTYATALTNGTVAEVLVLEGQRVEAGEPVARLVDADHRIALEAAEADLAIAEGELARAEARLSAEDERLETLIGSRRAAATSAAALRGAESALLQLDAEITAQESAVDALADEHGRKEGLVHSGAVSEGEVRRLAIALAGARAALEAIRARRPQLEARLEEARADRDAADESLERKIDERLGVGVARAEADRARGAVAKARAARDDAALQLERTTVRSTVDGIVMRRLVSPGSRIVIENQAHAAHIVHLYDPEHLQVRVDVPLADAAVVGLDQEAEVELSVLPDRTFRGHVTRMLHEADLQKNTVEVKVAIEDPSPILKPEMLARVRFLSGAGRATATRERLLVPERAVTTADGSASVWLAVDRIDRAARAELRSVTLGTTVRDGWVEVTAGVRPGDVVIPDPPAGLASGDTVEITGEEDR